MTDIEQEIKSKNLTAPRTTPADIEENVVGEVYFTAGEGVIGQCLVAARRRFGASDDQAPEIDDLNPSLNLLTFCVLTLKNGFTVTGESTCASPENFDAEIGRKIARQNAVSKVWPLMGYQLKSELAKDV